ncbi:MAG: response regulator [Lachnospiraceae bacterium]|nr:response regulator [Lachnospiraceae bacterium]
MKSLRTKITITIILVVLGSSMLLSIISYQRAKSSLIEQIEDNYSVAAQKYALELSSWVSTNATIIDTMAAEIAVNDISQKDYDTFHRYLQHSNELLNKNGFVYDVYFTYPNNSMVCASDFISDGSVDFVHEREWYTTSALTGELFYSTPYLDSDTQKSVITISKAVYKEGELLGVLAADIFVDVLIDMVKNADVEKDSYVCLIDQNMRMIVHPNPEYDYSDSPKEVMGIADAPYEDLVRAIVSNDHDMVFVNDYDGISRGISYSAMINTGWYVCIATGRDVLAAGVNSLVRGFVIATIFSVFISAIIALFLARVLDKLSKQEQEYKEQVLKLEKQAADEASRAKSRFLADMSHEIRTPINAIIGMNEMILRESNDKDIMTYSKNIRQSGQNLLQLINGILDFSKIEDGKMDIVPVKYKIIDQIAYFINSVSDRAKAKNLDLNLVIDENLPSEVFGDDTRINQVMMNLLTNAVKYTEKGTITLTMTEKERRDNKILIYFEVKDTGIGIRQSDMPKLFESFERLDVIRNRNIEGTGLGMAITVKLLKLMESELKVESKYGRGSIFSFTLWLDITDDTPIGDYKNAMDGSEEIASYKESFHAPNARILVVDDTSLNISVVENLLKNTEIKIDTSLNGQDAITLAQNNDYDVILMDQRMPGMDGTQAMKRIRDNEEKTGKKTPIICLTADVIRGARDRYIELGFDDYLTKPIDGRSLEEMLIKYIPEEKTEIVLEENSTDCFETIEKDEMLSELKGADVDIKTGMVYCRDIDTYRSILYTYSAEQKNKADLIAGSYKEKNWDDYGIYVHALKSSSRSIGAVKLSQLAAKAETAAKDGDTLTIDKYHQDIIRMYSRIAHIIDEHGNPLAANEKADEEVLEFEPS